MLVGLRFVVLLVLPQVLLFDLNDSSSALCVIFAVISTGAICEDGISIGLDESTKMRKQSVRLFRIVMEGLKRISPCGCVRA